MADYRRCVVGASILLAGAALAATAWSQSSDATYHLARTIPLGGDGSWDYLIADRAARRLYVTHGREIVVLDIDSAEVVGRISNLKRVHGVAFDPESERGFASDGEAGSIVIFDPSTLTVIGEIQAGTNPDAIVYDAVSKRVFAFNHASGDVTVIDPADGRRVGTIAIGGELEYAVPDGRGAIFVNVEDTSELVELDSRSLEIVARWPLAPCEEPTGLAMDLQSRRLFSACGNGKLIVTDADTGDIVADVAIGDGCDGVRFDPETGLIVTSNGEGTMSVIHEDSADAYRPLATIPTRPGARTLELDPSTHKVFTSAADRAGPPSAPGGRPSIVADTFAVLELDRF